MTNFFLQTKNSRHAEVPGEAGPRSTHYPRRTSYSATAAAFDTLRLSIAASIGT
jgi:hypothetical protein